MILILSVTLLIGLRGNVFPSVIHEYLFISRHYDLFKITHNVLLISPIPKGNHPNSKGHVRAKVSSARHRGEAVTFKMLFTVSLILYSKWQR